MTKNFLAQSQEMKKTLVEMRRCIHENAEWGDELPITTRFVMDKLKVLGLDAKEICKSGVVATIEGGKPGKTILLRADMDALPMKETNGLTFASKTAYAHTCGPAATTCTRPCFWARPKCSMKTAPTCAAR